MKFIREAIHNQLKEAFYKRYSHLSTNFPDVPDAQLLGDMSSEAQLNFESKIDLHEVYQEDINLLSDYVTGTHTSCVGKRLHALHKGYSVRVKTQVKRTPKILEIIDIFSATDADTYLVGGCVRDSILGHLPHDWDICTTLPYDDIGSLFKSNGWTVKEVGKQFLVVMVSKDGVSYEIANLRKDGTYADGRRPDSVQIGTLQEDAERRDFTCNALYWNFKAQELYDPIAQGIVDISEKCLRFVGNPKDRIKEDYLRAWRYMRFTKQLGFKGHKKTQSAIRENFKEIYENSNPQRVLQELMKFTDV